MQQHRDASRLRDWRPGQSGRCEIRSAHTVSKFIGAGGHAGLAVGDPDPTELGQAQIRTDTQVQRDADKFAIFSHDGEIVVDDRASPESHSSQSVTIALGAQDARQLRGREGHSRRHGRHLFAVEGEPNRTTGTHNWTSRATPCLTDICRPVLSGSCHVRNR